MATHTLTGPFLNGSAPGISDTFLNSMENDLVAAGAAYFLATPYQLTTNPTLNSGNTNTYTCTGGSTGVPTGAKAVYLAMGVFANTANGYCTIAPHGGSLSDGPYPAITGIGTAYTRSSCIIPLSAGGQIDVKANGSNMVLQSWYIYGYII